MKTQRATQKWRERGIAFAVVRLDGLNDIAYLKDDVRIALGGRHAGLPNK